MRASISTPRVLLLNDTRAFAGIEQHIFALACGLREFGHPVSVGCPDPSPLADLLHAANIEVIPLDSLKGVVGSQRKCLRMLKSNEIGLLHAHNGRTALFATVAIALAGTGTSVMTQHFLEPAHVKRRALSGVLSSSVHLWVNRRINQFISVSEASRQRALERGDAVEERITVIPNGIMDVKSEDVGHNGDIRSELGISAMAPLIVCASRLEVEKDIPCLVSAAVEVLKEHPSAVCLIAGEGRLRAQLQLSIKKLGLERSIKLIGFRSDVLSIIAASDCLVLPSAAEPFGLVLIEAMALRKPVVAVAAGGPLEIVLDEMTGLLVPPGNAGAMANAISRLLGSTHLRNEMGQRGFARYQAQFTAAKMAEATTHVYRRALAQSGNVQHADRDIERLSARS